MGCLLSAFTGPLLACGGTCLGSCVASCCTKAACSGHLSTSQARWLLLWLQVTSVLLVIGVRLTAKIAWLEGPCNVFKLMNQEGYGMCACQGLGDADSCMQQQLMYRISSATVLLFAFLAGMCLLGFKSLAALSCPGGKWISLVLLILVSAFLPNAPFVAFGKFAGPAAFLFPVIQALVLIDASCLWNDFLFEKSRRARLDLQEQTATAWLAGLVSQACLVFLLSIAGVIWYWNLYPFPSAHNVMIVGLCVGMVLLFISITEWCEHGNLFTSVVFLGYVVILAGDVGSQVPTEDDSRILPTALPAIPVALLSFIAMASGICMFTGSDDGVPFPQDSESGYNTMEKDGEASAPELSHKDGSEFLCQCITQAAAAVYVASILAPHPSWPSYATHLVALGLALCLYSWTLVAPKVLQSRTFN